MSNSYAIAQDYIDRIFAYSNASEEEIDAARSAYVAGYEGFDDPSLTGSSGDAAVQDYLDGMFRYTDATDEVIDAARSAYESGREEAEAEART